MTENSKIILRRLSALCSKTEKCESDALKYMFSRGLSLEEADEVLKYLTGNGFIDNKRYAESFVRDKSVFNRWGRDKIAATLKMKKISKEDINLAFEKTLDPEAEKNMVETELAKKLRGITKGLTKAQLWEKLMRFALSRGYSAKTAGGVIKKITEEY